MSKETGGIKWTANSLILFITEGPKFQENLKNSIVSNISGVQGQIVRLMTKIGSNKKVSKYVYYQQKEPYKVGIVKLKTKFAAIQKCLTQKNKEGPLTIKYFLFLL